MSTHSAAAKSARSAAPLFDSERVRSEFPILSRQVNGYPLIYLDSAASAQKRSAP